MGLEIQMMFHVMLFAVSCLGGAIFNFHVDYSDVNDEFTERHGTRFYDRVTSGKGPYISIIFFYGFSLFIPFELLYWVGGYTIRYFF